MTIQPATVEVAGKRYTVAAPADCAALAVSQFYRDFCTALLASDWRAISVPSTAVGPSPQMLARLVRAGLNHDQSICKDPATVRFVQLGSRLPVSATDAVATCESGIKDFAIQGGTTIFDYTSTDNSDPLRVVAP